MKGNSLQGGEEYKQLNQNQKYTKKYVSALKLKRLMIKLDQPPEFVMSLLATDFSIKQLFFGDRIEFLFVEIQSDVWRKLHLTFFVFIIYEFLSFKEDATSLLTIMIAQNSKKKNLSIHLYVEVHVSSDNFSRRRKLLLSRSEKRILI